MQNQWEPWACFPAIWRSCLGVMGHSDTRRVLLMSSLLCDLLLVAVSAENPASQRQDVGNRSRLFSAFVATSGYSALTLFFDFLPATIFYFIFFSFKATENLHVDKAINSHNKNTPIHIAKVSVRLHSEHAIQPALFHRCTFLWVCGVMVNSSCKY